MGMKNEFDVKTDLSLVLLEEGFTAEEVADAIGISRRTLFNILSGSVQTSNDSLEKIYSFIYKDGYRLNKLKEEFYKDSGKLVLFHGAKEQIEEITNNGSRDRCDFGPAFYLGETYHQASNFVCEYDEASVYTFFFEKDGLIIKEFNCDLDWMIAICYYRGTIDEYSNHPKVQSIIKEVEAADVIIAPIADNKMFQVMQLFADGEITSEQAYHSLSSSTLGKQYVLRTDRAIKRLKQLNRLYLCKEEKDDCLTKVLEHAQKIEDELNEAKRKYRREGLYIDELFK